jgi:hypothetical protein
MASLMQFPVLPAVLISAVSFALGCFFFRKKSLSIAIFEWFLAFLFLLLCGLDLFIEGNAWPSIVSVLIVAASEAVFLPWFVQAAVLGHVPMSDAGIPQCAPNEISVLN